MNKHKKIWIGMLAVACIAASGFGTYTALAEAKAEEIAVAWEGFEISAAAVRTAAPVGLRFKTDVERLTSTMKKYNADAEYYTTLTLTTANGYSYSTTVEATVWRPDGSGWNTVLLGIPESDYETQVTAQSFIKLNGKETAFYQTEPVTISIAQTAAAAMSYGATSEYITQYVEDVVMGVSLDRTSVELEEGQSAQLLATTTPTGYMAKFSSSNSEVATVSAQGKVTARGVGNATVTAEINGYKASCTVSVTEKNEILTGFASSTSLSFLGDRDFSISGTWLDGVFADERIDAFTFDAKSDKGMTLESDSGYSVDLAKNTTKTITFTRSMYEAFFKASDENNFVLTSDLSSLSTATINYSNFKKVWAEEASRTLTKAEISQLGATPEDDYAITSYKFDFFGYSALTDGTWKEYDVETGETTSHFSGEDYRNVYRIEEYKDAGMTILFPQSACAIAATEEDFDFSSSKLKEVMDMSLQAGINKVVVADYRLYALIGTEGIVGEGKQFATEAELDTTIKAYMKDYASHSAFYGVMLTDEPSYTCFEAYGQVYKAIKRCYPNAYIQCNLFPPVGGSVGSIFPEPTSDEKAKYTNLGFNSSYAERFAAYEKYLTMFLDSTGADYVMFDQYPLNNTGIYDSYIGGMQVVANVCAQRGVKFQFVSQTMTMQQGASESDNATYNNQRILTEEDLRWLNNMQLGFGVKQIAYFTYFTKQAASSGERFIDGGAFITNNGEKTDLYYSMRKILAENQKFAPVILSFDYQTSTTYIADGFAYSTTNANYCSAGSFAKVSGVSVNTESALVSELYDDINDRYMYMVQNITDSRSQTAGTIQTVKLIFNENYEYAEVWKNGEKSIVKLESNTFIVKQNSGEAVYVIPFNADDSNDDGFAFDFATGDNGAWFPKGNGEN